MNYLLALFIFLVNCLCTKSSSAETVKVVSRLGATKANGSGWLVNTPMGVSVVTCPHVLIPKGNVEVQLENVKGPISAREVWADWARGITFLQLDTVAPVQIS